MLLRDKLQMALNEVETLSIEAADHYASLTGDAAHGLEALFGSIGERHRQFATTLADHIRALGDLPQHPDPDREAVGAVVSGLRALLSSDTRGTLIEQREQSEQALINAVHAALDHDMQSETRTLLLQILEHATEAKKQLEAERNAPPT